MTRKFSEAYSTLLSVDFTETDEMTSSAFYPAVRTTQSTILLGADQDGTLDLDVQLSDGTWYETLAGVATVADSLTSVTLEFNPVAVRARWTPSVAPGSVCIDASYSQTA